LNKRKHIQINIFISFLKSSFIKVFAVSLSYSNSTDVNSNLLTDIPEIHDIVTQGIQFQICT